MQNQFSQHVPIRYSLELLDLLREEYGLSRASLEDCYQLCSSELELPEGYVPVQNHAKVCELAVEKTGDPWLGIKLGQRMSPPRFGALGAAASSCQRVADMLEMMASFGGTLVPVNGKLFVQGDQARMEYWLPSVFLKQPEFHVQATLSSTISMLENAVGYLPKRLKMYLPIPQLDGYEHHLPFELEFDQGRLAIDLPLNYIDNPLLSSDPAARRLFLQACASMAAELKSSRTLGASINQMLHNCEFRYPSLEQVADRMHVTTRTLRNRLAKEALSYRDMVKRHRIEQAKALLNRETVTVDEVADVLGYSTTGSFCRAFKRETDVTPTHYRRLSDKL